MKGQALWDSRRNNIRTQQFTLQLLILSGHVFSDQSGENFSIYLKRSMNSLTPEIV